MHQRRWLAWSLGALMVLAGLNHFRVPEVYLRIMPPFLPWHRALVFLSGVVEAGFGALLFHPRTRRLGAVGLVATLIVVFPANVYMATSTLGSAPAVPEAPAWAAWARLPFQALFIAWALACAKRPASAGADAGV